MNTQYAEDTLFLSVQAESVLHSTVPLFGKVMTDTSANLVDTLLYLPLHTQEPLPSLRYVRAIICTSEDPRFDVIKLQEVVPVIVVASDVVFSQGDVISVSERGRIHRYFRAKSQNNAFLVTEACNNLCIMCPQPPKPLSMVNHEAIEKRILQTLDLIDDEHLPASLCITGGEPTMLKEGLFRIVEGISVRTPQTLIHLLTNGRYLSNEHYTARLAQVGRQQLLAGIPLFGHVSEIHDYVVQCEGAFEQTMNGLLNCYKHGVNIELRVVLNKVTVKYLKALAEFISRNLFFVKHVALMGMENMGFAKLNRDTVFIDPWEYKDQLSTAIEVFQLYGIDVRIFNLPFCVVNADAHAYCKQSISDFKNCWHIACDPCVKRESCCGFFSSSTEKFWLSRHINPFVDESKFR